MPATPIPPSYRRTDPTPGQQQWNRCALMLRRGLPRPLELMSTGVSSVSASRVRESDERELQLWSVVSTEPEHWLERYRSGESAAVWREMRDPGLQIRSEKCGVMHRPSPRRRCSGWQRTSTRWPGDCGPWDTGSPIRLKFTDCRRGRLPPGLTLSRSGMGHCPCPCGRSMT